MNSEETAKSEAIESCATSAVIDANTADEFEVQWMERAVVDDARIGAMYCFKNCDKNKN